MYFDNNGYWGLFSATGNPLFYLAYRNLIRENKDREQEEIERLKR